MSISGGQKPAVRIQANPDGAVVAMGLNLEDLRTAIAAGQRQPGQGKLRRRRQAYTIGANDQLLTSDDYRKLIVAYRNGAPVHAVGRGRRGRRRRKRAPGGLDERRLPAVIVNIQRQPGANIIDVVDRVKQLLPQLKASLPASIDVDDSDRPHDHDPRLRRGRAVRADADHRRWW